MPDLSQVGRILRNILFEDLLLKLFCLVLAVLLWFYIDGELMDQKEVEVQLQPAQIALPAGMELAPYSSLPRFMLRIRGPRRRLQLITSDNITIVKKLIENPRAGRNVVTVDHGDFVAPGFEIVDVMPKEAAIETVTTTTAPRAVRVKLRGEPKQGYIVGQPTSDPAEVSCEVPDKDVNAFSYVYTEEVDISNADHDVVREVSIAPTLNIEGRTITWRCHERVRVTVPIRPMLVTKQMTLDVRAFVPPGVALAIEPKSVPVEIVAEERDLTAPDVMSRVYVYVQWPAGWERPKNASTVLGPLKLPVEVFAPPHVQVHGSNNGPLPMVEVKGMAAP